MSEVDDFLKAVQPARRHSEAAELNEFFKEVTGWDPVFYKGGMLGYGTYDYTYKSGRSGSWFATGFAPRRAKISIYIMPGYGDYSPILKRLGKHSMGKSCLYLNKLADADMDVLADVVRAGLLDLTKQWPIEAT